MSLIVSLVRGGTNNYSSPQEAFSPYAIDMMHDGVFDPKYLRVQQQTVANFTVLINAGAALVSATPSSEALRKFRATLSANYTLAAQANATGSTRYDILYLALPPATLRDPASSGDQTEAACFLWERHTAAGEPLIAAGIPLAEVTVANGAATIVTANITDRRQMVHDGWLNVGVDAATYASATTFTYPADLTSLIQQGDKLRMYNGTAFKQFYVQSISVAANVTTITVNAGNVYTLANAAITALQFSKLPAPAGFPIWFAYSPNPGAGGAMAWAGAGSSEFMMIGNDATVKATSNGVASGTPSGTINQTLPIPAAAAWDSASVGFPVYVNNAGASDVGFAYIAGGKFTASRSGGGNFTLGPVGFQTRFSYKVA